MRKLSQTKTAIALGLLLLTGVELHAQIAILTKPVSGSVVMDAWLPYGDPPPISSIGTAPDYTAAISLAGTSFPGEYHGGASAGNSRVSAQLGKVETWNYNGRAESRVAYSMNVYADAVPESNVRMKFQGNYSISWTTGSVWDDYTGFSFYPVTGPSQSGGLTKTSYTLPYAAITDGAQFVADIQPKAVSSINSGGKVYYLLGNFTFTGRGILGSANSAASISYETEVSGIQAYYVGPALIINDAASNNQAGLVGKGLPKLLSVMVTDRESGQVSSGIPITFNLAEPINGARFSNGQTSISVLTDSNGVAEAAVTLGTVTGSYTIKATCPLNSCTSGGKEVAFTATAGTINLSAIGGMCTGSSAVGQRPAAMRVGAFNTVTEQYATSLPILFSPISFTNMSGYTSVGFPNSEPLNCVVLANGYRSCSPGPLRSEGTYTFKADCADCPGVKSVVCQIYTHKNNVPASLPEASSANPFDRDPITNKPLTPVVRVQEVITQNTNESFTSDAAENFVRLKALVLPDDFAEESVVTWKVIDDPRDNYESAIPAQNPVPATGSKFDAVYRVWLDNVDGGRPAPLRYLVTAKAVAGDKEALSPFRELRQDEIDKCRQEYVDYNIGVTEVSKSRFTAGLHPEYSKQVRDCFAYIYPAREAQKVNNLRAAGHAVKVTSGYRSPRHNIYYVGSTASSTHIFGEAVDISPVDANLDVEGWKELWEANHQETCPKSLERSPTQVMMWCRGSESEPSPAGSFPVGVTSANNDEMVYGRATCIHLGDPWKQ